MRGEHITGIDGRGTTAAGRRFSFSGDILNQNFLGCINNYKAAVKAYDESKNPTKHHINEINAFFYIIAHMRAVYGCPKCWSIERCPCEVMPPQHKAVRLSKDHPEILW
jgi:hypothetical protein